jgi:phosphatidylinositol alpha-1,6-mannosyltransferase
VLAGKTGLVVNGRSSSEVAQAVIELLNDEQRCTEMGAAGRKWIIKEWRWDIWATAFANLVKVDR